MARADSDRGFIKRLEEIVGEFPSRAALARAADLPPSSLQSYLEGAEPTRPALVALARAADVSLEWLADDRGYKKPHPHVPDGYGEIPFYDIRKSGGYVYPLVTEEIQAWVYLKLDLFSYAGMQSGKLFLVEALGSQAAEIADGDLLVVDPAWRTKFVGPSSTIPPGNYLVSRQAKLSIREVTGVRGDVVELAMPDDSGRKETSRVGEEGFTIHGRIIWYGRALPIVATVKTASAARAVHRRKKPVSDT
jgi:hypothetical protein